MPTEVVKYEARRFVIRFEDENEYYGFKFDVFKLISNSEEDWVEVFQAIEDESESFGQRLVLAAPLSEVVEFLEKLLSFLKEG